MYATQLTGLALGLTLSAGACAERYRWERVLEAEPVAIAVEEVSPRELRRIERKYTGGSRPDRQVLSAAMSDTQPHKGFALLFRSGGDLYCRIYVTDATDEATLAHEERHCHGWTH